MDDDFFPLLEGNFDHYSSPISYVRDNDLRLVDQSCEPKGPLGV